MQIGMIGLGRMGANMVRRLLKGGHECVAYDRSADAVKAVVNAGARGAGTIAELVDTLSSPRAVWIMVPAGLVDSVIAELRPLLKSGDILIDGGNSHYHDDIRRADGLRSAGIHYVDVGTSGGVLGFEQGYCLMIGGEPQSVGSLEPIFATLSPGGRMPQGVEQRARRHGTAEMGYLHCGLHGAGHFVKMVHNGIEYGLMAAYAEGLNILRHADAGNRPRDADAETTPLRHPEYYRYDFDLSEIAEVWRRGSVISSWLLDLTAAALADDASLKNYAGRVSDSGEGRWTIAAAIDEGVPAPVLSAALFQRFSSRGGADFANRVLSALRHEFGGHIEKTSEHSKP
jgi:6-phosphogluconate dehydrogenase